MKTRFKMLKREGKGNKPQASVALTDNDVDILFSKSFLGSSSAISLLNTIWLNNCMYFGMRGGLEHRTLQWGDIQLLRDSNGREFLQHNTIRKAKQKHDKETILLILVIKDICMRTVANGKFALA